jgi:3-methylfumaryl-CoA hydratase
MGEVREVVISEEQDLVYREPGANGPARSGQSVAVTGRDRTVAVDPVLLFRFSALTYNAHRIHYDREFARAEGYPGLVVHGPLQALLMAEQARSRGPAEYSYRLVAPLYDDQGLIVSAVPDGDAVRVSCRDASDRVTSVAG